MIDRVYEILISIGFVAIYEMHVEFISFSIISAIVFGLPMN